MCTNINAFLENIILGYFSRIRCIYVVLSTSYVFLSAVYKSLFTVHPLVTLFMSLPHISPFLLYLLFFCGQCPTVLLSNFLSFSSSSYISLTLFLLYLYLLYLLLFFPLYTIQYIISLCLRYPVPSFPLYPSLFPLSPLFLLYLTLSFPQYLFHLSICYISPYRFLLISNIYLSICCRSPLISHVYLYLL